jgi:hypothetical protein
MVTTAIGYGSFFIAAAAVVLRTSNTFGVQGTHGLTALWWLPALIGVLAFGIRSVFRDKPDPDETAK